MRAEPRFKPLPLEAATLLSEGKVHEALKVLRRTEGIGRGDARRRVDAYIAQEPLLRVQIETQLGARRRRLFFWFLLVDLAITAGIIYWFFYRGSA
ncbi:MAG TPA: hypothetical protein VIV63_01595 [Steroidobacteraceae bacterium]